MTINFFLQSRDFGGAEKFAMDLLTELALKKNRVILYTSNPVLVNSISKSSKIEVYKIPIYLDFVGNKKGLVKSFVLSPLAIIYYFKTLLIIKKRKNKQIIICSGFSEKIFVAPIAGLLSLQVNFIEYGPLEPLFVKFFGLPKLLYSFAKKFSNKIIVSSNRTKNALKKTYPLKKLFLIRCGSPMSNNDIKLPDTGQVQVSIVSRLEKGKGQDLAIKAWQLIKDKPKNAELLIIGKGGFEKTLKKLAKNDKSIVFLSYVEKLDKTLAQSSIILCPSVWDLEGFGLVVTEAMALKKPIIAFDRAPYNEILLNKTNALLVKDGDIEELSKTIKFLIHDKNLQMKLARQAYKDYLEKYQISEVAENYLKLLQN